MCYCEQCGEEIKEGDEIVRTCFNHIIHYDCQDDYIDALISCEFTNGIFTNGKCEWEGE